MLARLDSACNHSAVNLLAQGESVNLRIALPVCLALVVAAFLPVATSAQASCEALANLTLTNATITSAASVAAGSYKPPATPGLPVPTKTLPAFCRVAGIAKPTSDSEIHFEVWLPASGWNGKFEQVGNGGFAGMIPFAGMAEPLLHGYATAATDDGHANGPNQTWAIGHPEKVADFGYRAVHETAVQAKAIVHAFYGKDARRNYFVGCSEGGREGLTEAQRYPKDFHGSLPARRRFTGTRYSFEERGMLLPSWKLRRATFHRPNCPFSKMPRLRLAIPLTARKTGLSKIPSCAVSIRQ